MPFTSRLRALFKTQSQAESERRPHRRLSPFNQKRLLHSLDAEVREGAGRTFVPPRVPTLFSRTKTRLPCSSSTPAPQNNKLCGARRQRETASNGAPAGFSPCFATNEFIYCSVFCFIPFTGISRVLKERRPSFICFIMPVKSPQPVVAPLLSPLLVSWCNLSSYFLKTSYE